MPTVDLFHFNDFHRHLGPAHDGLGGAARLSTLAREQVKAHPDSVLINLGDVAGDQSAHGQRDFDPIPQVFNRMGVQLHALGNHEFEDPANHYGSLREGLINKLDGQTLCANVTHSDSGKPIENTLPYTIRQLQGINVAFIAVVTEDLASKLFPAAGEGLRAARMEDVLAKLVPEVKGKGADAVVVLSHESLRESAQIAEAVPGIDVIIAGHDHRVTEKPVLLDNPHGRTWMAEAGAYGMMLGHIQMHVDETTRKVTSVDGGLIQVTPDIAPDPAVQAIVDRWKPLPRAEHHPTKQHWTSVPLSDLKKALEDRAAGVNPSST